jgi:hypothetical protein
VAKEHRREDICSALFQDILDAQHPLRQRHGIAVTLQDMNELKLAERDAAANYPVASALNGCGAQISIVCTAASLCPVGDRVGAVN